MTAERAGLRLGIDLGPLARGATGIATYVRGLLSARERLGATSLVGFVNRPSLAKPRLGLDADTSAALRLVHSRVPRRLLNQLWLGRDIGGIEDLTGPLDVFHAADLLAPASRGAAIVLTVHDLAWHREPTWADPATLAWLRRWFAPSLERADAVIVPSRATAQDLERAFSVARERIHVVPHGVSPVFRPERERADEDVLRRHGVTPGYLLWVGALDRRKDLAVLAEALLVLGAGDVVRAPLVVVGPDAGGAAAFDTMLARLGVQDRSKRLGRVDAGDLPALYRGARLALYLSRAEGFGLPVLEAMACGVPVVTSRIGALEEVAGGAARLVHTGDAKALARAIEAVLSEEGTTGTRVREGLARAASFTWERAAELTGGVYRAAAERRALTRDADRPARGRNR